MSDETLPVAHRVWAEPVERRKKGRGRRGKRLEPAYVLAFDTETTADHLQSLTFGSWRYYRIDDEDMRCVDEGIFHADDLGETYPEGLAVLEEYVVTHRADTERDRSLRLLSRSEFVEKVLFRTIEAGGRVIGFNLPFDLARLAIEVTDARGVNLGGHSLVLAKPKKGTQHKERKHRPRIVIKHRDAKGSFISLTKPMGADEGSSDRGRFVDCRTLAFSLTGEAYSLGGACRAFGVPGKIDAGGHGQITPKYVDYNRRDVAATAGLYEALIAEFRRNPIDLEPERAFSPASLSKAYWPPWASNPFSSGIGPFQRRSSAMQWPPSSAVGLNATFVGCPCRCGCSTSPRCTRPWEASWICIGSS
jgi:hypothetical protein